VGHVPDGQAPATVPTIPGAATGFGLARLNGWLERLAPLLIGALAGRLLVLAWTAGREAASGALHGGTAAIALLGAGICLGAGGHRLRQPPERIAIAALLVLLAVAGSTG
jgi:hypothetical protein